MIFFISRKVQFHINSKFLSCCEIFVLMIRKTVSMKMLGLKFFCLISGFAFLGVFLFVFLYYATIFGFGRKFLILIN